jgi:hypothetical protein
MPTQTKEKIYKCRIELVCIRQVQRLLGIKPIYTFTRYAWIAFFLLTFWTTLAPLVVSFANSFGKSFQSLFANGQRYVNKISRSIFRILNFLPLFQMLFL